MNLTKKELEMVVMALRFTGAEEGTFRGNEADEVELLNLADRLEGKEPKQVIEYYATPALIEIDEEFGPFNTVEDIIDELYGWNDGNEPLPFYLERRINGETYSELKVLIGKKMYRLEEEC